MKQVKSLVAAAILFSLTVLPDYLANRLPTAKAISSGETPSAAGNPGPATLLVAAGGSLTGSSGASPGNVNLTTEGTADWTHWGLTTPTSFNHKSGVASQISNYTKIGSAGVQRQLQSPTSCSWTAGTPTATATNTTTGVYIIGIGNGFQLSMPADMTDRALNLYLGVWLAQGRLEATLSDASAPAFIDTSVINQTGTTNVVFTLNYRAGTSGQTLTVRWTEIARFNNFGNITMQAATMVVNSGPPVNQPPTVNAGNDQTVSLPNSAALTGTASDDGLPNPPVLTTTWSQVSGPATVSFANANALNTTASFSLAGVYVLRLTADDSVLTSSDDVVLTINNSNQAPTVNAGSDQIITLPANAALTGSASDDGLPNPPGALTTTWSKVSGPGTVSFTNANALNTTAAFSLAGVYVLRLTADDSNSISSDDLSVTVNSASAGGSLTGSSGASPGNVNLTTEGTADWTHWGLTTATSFNRKSGVAPQISNYTKIGNGGVARVNANSVAYTWSNGTPTANASNTASGIYVLGIGNGFQLSMPADSTDRTLKFYVGVWSAQGRLEATLSDASAPAFIDTSVINQTDTTNVVYTLNYRAGTNGQTLTIRWTEIARFNNFGNISMQAAALNDGTPPPPPSSEFQISSSAAFAQLVTHVAADPNGNFIVVWQSNGQDGSGWGIFARRYNATGVPLGNEFQVNTLTADNQFVPRVALDANSNFVIVWESKGQDGSGYGISCQRYNSAGVAQGGEFRVNTTTLNDQHDPFIAMDPNGNFVVVWTSDLQDGSLDGVFGQRFDAAGVPQSGEFQVNTYTTDIQGTSSVSMDANGNFVVVWHSQGQDGSGLGSYGQRYSATGVMQGGETRLNTTTLNSQMGPYVAMAPTGDFVVTWASTAQDGSLGGVFAQRYNAAGVPQGGEFQVNTFTLNNQTNPAAAIDPNGDFVIVWESQNQDGSGKGIYGQRYNALGAPLGGEFQVNTYTTNNQSYPFVAKDANANFVVVWTSTGQDGSSDGVFGRRYDAAGNTLNLPFMSSNSNTVQTTLSGSPLQKFYGRRITR